MSASSVCARWHQPVPIKVKFIFGSGDAGLKFWPCANNGHAGYCPVSVDGRIKGVQWQIFVAAILVLGLLSGCAVRKEDSAPVQPTTLPTTEACPVLHVLAPGNYIVDIAAEANVVLDPAWHEFRLYCDKLKAREALEAMTGNGLQPGQWRIYTLEGSPRDIAKIENGRLILAKPARLAGWLEETE